jgi:tetratricopeptide (TPR) repeat protein
MSSGEIMSSQVLADELVSLAGELGDEQSSCEAHIAQAGTLYNRGRLVDALDHAETVFDRSSEALAEVVPLSGVVQAALYGGAAAAVLGLTDRARRFLDQIVSALQRSDADPIAQILGSVSRSVVSVWLRDFDTVRASCDELQSVGTQFGIDIIVGWAEIYGGWAGSMIGDATGVDRISAGLAKHVAARQRLGLDHSLGLLAESQLMAGRFDDAFATVADALLLPDQNMQIQHTCELHRLRAELHASTGEYEAARKDFGDALDMATEMGAGLLELRVGAALARFCGTRGKPLEGRALLGSIVARHDVDSFDGQNARAILSDLDNMQMS